MNTLPPVAAAPLPTTPRAFSCQCGRPVFFRNSFCLACGTPLGYESHLRFLLPLEPSLDGLPVFDEAGNAVSFWRRVGAGAGAARYRRCGHLETAAACNWLVGESEVQAGAFPLCRSCRLTRTLPDLSNAENARWWMRIELAKRRLVSSLIGLNLPVLSRTFEDPQRGLVFDLLRSAPGALAVVTGHADGVITLDIEEADDAWREQRRAALGEPYRTLLGHLRHECGHYYWQRLVDGSDWLPTFREIFGDERQDYAQALQAHYAQGSPTGWGLHFVSAYASSHPWEDWAETWAHYLHLHETLDTAHSFGLHGEGVELHYERFNSADVAAGNDETVGEFLNLINGWMELTGVLNELSRSMGVADFYPFVLSVAAVRKLYLVHRVIASAGTAAAN